MSTYAYVNPLVAVLLGWLLAGERLGTHVLLAAALVIGAVVLITLPRRQVRPPVEAEAQGAAPSWRPWRKSAPRAQPCRGG